MASYRRLHSGGRTVLEGPCPFTGQGHDRFTYVESPTFEIGGKTMHKWFCRKSCPTCPGRVGKNGNYGMMESKPEDWINYSADFTPTKPQRELDAQWIESLARQITPEIRQYLNQRGISDRLIAAAKLGYWAKAGAIVIPHYKGGKLIGAKLRFCGVRDKGDRYRMFKGSKAKELYGEKILAKAWPELVVCEGVLDSLMLRSIGIAAVAPFGGGGMWDNTWPATMHALSIINIADRDQNGQGMEYALRRAASIGLLAHTKEVYTVYPPEGHKDIGEAQAALGSESILKWIKTMKGEQKCS